MSISTLQRPGNNISLYANSIRIRNIIPNDDNELTSKKYVDDQINKLKLNMERNYNVLIEKYIILFDKYVTEKYTNISEITNIKKTNHNKPFNIREKRYLSHIDSVFKSHDNKKSVEEIVKIINGNSKISLRLIDWFVTIYSKQHNIITSNIPNKRINVYSSYRSILNCCSKLHFSPFRRPIGRYKRKFMYTYDKKNNKQIYTTIGQLWYFIWVIGNKIINYINQHYDNIFMKWLNT